MTGRDIVGKVISSEADARLGLSVADLREAACKIRALRQRATEHAVEIGRELLRVKASLPHGAFVKWVEKECEFKIRTAQDLMKLAREVDANAELIALMVPSTLRVFLSKATPTSVRSMVLDRLQNGERVSRNDLASAVVSAKAGLPDRGRGVPGRDDRPRDRSPRPDLLTAGDLSADTEIEKARRIAAILHIRLSRDDYDYIVSEANWGAWNRVLIWLRAAKAPPHRLANRLEIVTSPSSESPVADRNVVEAVKKRVVASGD